VVRVRGKGADKGVSSGLPERSAEKGIQDLRLPGPEEVGGGLAGGKQETGERSIRAGELRVGQWRWAPVIFQHPGGRYETRVFWPGDVPFAVDAIGLWRIEEP